RPELSQFTNIILLPIVGYRSLASLLSGGDYDGDQVLIIWQPEILDKWIENPSNIRFADEPINFSENFEGPPPTVHELLGRYPKELSDRDKRIIVKEVQNEILSTISIRKEIGMYSTWHDKAAAKLGHGSPQ
ncbi:15058_t:CDS:2, partial [Acaulospora colombiana]